MTRRCARPRREHRGDRENLTRAVSIAMLVLTAACDMASSPPPTACSQIGAQCQMPDGPLGVCQETRCEPGATPPCFACTPQH